MLVSGVHGLQPVEECGTVVPGCPFAAFHHVVAVLGTEGETLHVDGLLAGGDFLHKALVVGHDAVVGILVKFHQVHLVHCQCNALDAEERAEKGVAAGLGDDACAGIDKQDGQVRRRTAGNHVAGILFVPRSVGDDEFAAVGREVAVCHVNRDALFAFCLQSVEQQGVVNFSSSGISHTFAVAFECRKLVFIEFFGVEEQTADERTLAVVHTAGCKQAQKVLLLVLVKVFFYRKSSDDSGGRVLEFHMLCLLVFS